MNPHGAPLWYEYLSADPDAARSFYGPVVGWTVGDAPPGGMDYRMIDTGTGQVGGMMRIMPEMAAGGARPGWLIYFCVDDVDAAVDRAVAAGSTIHMPATTLDGIGRLAMLADPQGAPFYVMRGAVDDTSTAFMPSDRALPGHAVWNELAAPDADAAIAFYAEQFGWRQGGAMPMGELGDYQFLLHGDDPIGAAMGVVRGARPGWQVYFHVPDIDAAATQVTAGGGAVIQGPDQIPGGDYSVVAEDPEGARFGLVGSRKEG
jgi:uncharacterized protein